MLLSKRKSSLVLIMASSNQTPSMQSGRISDIGDAERKNMKILVVDDDPDITSLYKATLEGQAGFKVDTYNDPREALSNFKPHYYNISLIDVRMSGMDGFDLYKELKKLDPIIKVCFITGYEVNYKALQEIFPELAQECYISKSITMKKLKEHVDYLLQDL